MAERYTDCQSHPLQDRSAVVAFFQATSRLRRDLLTEWPHPVLMFDMTTMPLDQVVTRIMSNVA